MSNKKFIIEEETTETPVPIGAVMAKLKDNTRERNDAYDNNKMLKNKNNSLMAIQFQTFGRLVKYEPSVFNEVLEYAEANSAMVHIDSHLIGEYSVIGDYTTKAGKTFKAHFTKYGGYIRKCTEGEKPISYKGYFPYKTYKNKFVINRSRETYSTLEDFLMTI